MQKDIAVSKKFLDGLGTQLKGLKRASLPLQEHLAMNISLEEKRKHAARLLPPPLYVLYTQFAAAKEAFEDTFEISIQGSVADAESLARKAAAAEVEALRGGDAAEGSGAGDVTGGVTAAVLEEGDEEDAGGRVAKRPRISETADATGGDGTYATHPLTVRLVLSDVPFTFRYLSTLHIVTVEVTNMVGDRSKGSKGGKSAKLEEDLLVNLFPGDTGTDTPNTANKLRQRGFEFDTRGRRDRPYQWVQHLAGIDFLPAVPVGRALPDEEAAAVGVAEHQEQARVRNVLAALRARMASRSSLK